MSTVSLWHLVAGESSEIAFVRGEDLYSSRLASIGRSLELVFSPLGLDCRYSVATIASFLSSAAVVGTLGTIFGIESEDEDSVPFAKQITASGLSVASGAALVVFFTISLKCVSTLALLPREPKSAHFAAKMMAGYLALAWVAAFGIYLLPLLLS